MILKQCSIKAGCGKILPLVYFNKDKNAKDLHKNICRSCSKNKGKIWRSKKKEYIKSQDAKRYVANKEKINNRSKAWIEKNPGYHQQWYQKNREKHLARSKNWAKNNLDKKLAATLKRKAIKLNQMGWCPEDYWERLLAFYGDKCMNPNCSGHHSTKLTLDHVIPLHLGGLHDMSNFQILCLSCNCSKGKKHMDYRKEKIYEILL